MRVVYFLSNNDADYKKIVYASVEYASIKYPLIKKMPDPNESIVSSERRINFSQDFDIIDFSALEKYSKNSEFVLNHNENDKIGIFNRIDNCKRVVEKEFNKR